MKNNLTHLPDDLADQVTELLSHGGTIGFAMDYDEKDYEVIYALGHSLYNQGRYQEAMRTFGYLVLHNHLEKRYMNAFASSLKMLKNYKEAIKFYSFASLMDMSDPLPTYHTAECMIAAGYTAEAKEALGFVIRQSTSSELEILRSRAQAMLDLINKR